MNLDKQLLKNHQYKNDKNLSTRKKFLSRYATNHQSVWNWVIQHYTFPIESKILEVGGGNGEFWKEAVNILPQRCDVTLTDFSEGMLEDATKNLKSILNCKYETADVENLRYADNTFDIVLSHLMLYHTDSPERAITEIKRVVNFNGYVGILLSGENNMMPLFQLLGLENPRQAIRFTAEIAIKILPNYFSNIQKFEYNDLLKISDVEPVIDYLKSFSSMRDVTESFYSDCRIILKNHLRKFGCLTVPISRFLFLVK
jgi:ubiquinone/menaquinone biosynthesis C-methylase UbiE